MREPDGSITLEEFFCGFSYAMAVTLSIQETAPSFFSFVSRSSMT